MIEIALVEDDIPFRDDIQEYLDNQADMKCALVTDSVELLLKNLKPERLPDIVLMDIRLPGMSGISGIKLLKERYPELDIVMLTVYNDSDKIFEAICAGASGYLLKNAPFSEIKASLEMLYQGGAPMSPPIARKVIRYLQGRTERQENSQLSPREKEVVIGLVDGLSYKMIADRMGISTGTICSHIKNIYKKLHVHSKAEVIRKSLRGEI